jgi:purine-binding chemotaxis protein CheW
MTQDFERANGKNSAYTSSYLAILTFQLGGQMYGLPVNEVVQIIEMVAFTRLPQAPFAVQGIINLRGKIAPVIDLRLRFDLPLIPYGLHTPIILVKVKEQNLGLIVDWVEEVAQIAPADLEIAEAIIPFTSTNPQSSPGQPSCLVGVAKVERRLIPILKAEAILSLAEQSRLMDQVALTQEQLSQP